MQIFVSLTLLCAELYFFKADHFILHQGLYYEDKMHKQLLLICNIFLEIILWLILQYSESKLLIERLPHW